MPFIWIQNPKFACSHPEFHQTYMRAREVRADIAFGEQILDIADNTANDWHYNEKTGKLTINKAAILRSKLKIEARRFHMERLHRDTWGEKVQADITTNYAAMSEEERVAKALELIGVIKEIAGPRPKPLPLVYVPEEGPDEEPSGIGS